MQVLMTMEMKLLTPIKLSSRATKPCMAWFQAALLTPKVKMQIYWNRDTCDFQSH